MSETKSQATSQVQTAVEVRRQEILLAALDEIEDALVVLDRDGIVVFWNTAAEQISGHTRAERIGHPLPERWLHAEHPTAAPSSSAKGHFYTGPLTVSTDQDDPAHLGTAAQEHAVRRLLHHAHGDSVPVLMHQSLLRDPLGARIGALLRFYPAEESDRLPHGEGGEQARVSQAQDEMQEWLEETWRSAQHTSIPFGILWLFVDQGKSLRRTHGADACEAMMQAVERALRHGLRPAEMLGRWGESEFLVLSRERTLEMLVDHAHQLAGLARTADFRWWGDRLALTVSIGAAQWQPELSLSHLLAQAQSAMQASAFAGGNQVSRAHADGAAVAP